MSVPPPNSSAQPASAPLPSAAEPVVASTWSSYASSLASRASSAVATGVSNLASATANRIFTAAVPSSERQPPQAANQQQPPIPSSPSISIPAPSSSAAPHVPLTPSALPQQPSNNTPAASPSISVPAPSSPASPHTQRTPSPRPFREDPYESKYNPNPAAPSQPSIPSLQGRVSPSPSASPQAPAAQPQNAEQPKPRVPEAVKQTIYQGVENRFGTEARRFAEYWNVVDNGASAMSTVAQWAGILPSPVASNSQQPPSASPAHNSQAPNAPAPPPAAPQGEQNPMVGMLQWVLGGLQAAVTSQAKQAALTCGIWGLERLKTSVENTHGFNPKKPKKSGYGREYTFLNQLIDACKAAQVDEHQIGAVYVLIRQGLDSGMSIGGVTIPDLRGKKPILQKKHSSVSDAYDQRMSLREQRIKTVEKIDYDRKIQEQKQLFIENTSRFASFKTVDSLFHLNLGNETYFQIIKKARQDPQNASKTLRQEFYKKIDESQIASKWLAKAAYRMVTFIMPMLTDETAAKLVTFAEKTIEENEPDEFSQASQTTVLNFRNYLATLRGCFERVADNNDVSTRLDPLIAKELQKAKYNDGFTQQELHESVAKVVVKDFAPRFEFANWIEKLTRPLYQIMVIGAICRLLSWVWWVAFSWLQGLLNWVRVKVLTSVVIKTGLINQVLNTSVKAISNNGYMHAMNKLLLNRLQAIWKLMNAKDGKFDAQVRKQPRVEKKEFTGIVKDLLSILDLSQCDNRQEVAQLLKHPSLSQQVRHLGDEFVIKDTVESAARLLFIAWESNRDKEELKSQLSSFMELVNDSYNEGKDVSPEEYLSTEQELHSLKESITNLAIRKSLEDKLNFSAKGKQQLADKYATSMKASTLEMVEEQQEFLSQLSSKPSKDIADQMHQNFETFLTTITDQRARDSADQNFKSDLDKTFSSLNHEFNTKTQPITKALRSILNLYSDKQNLSSKEEQILKTHVRKIEKALEAIETWANEAIQAPESLDFPVSLRSSPIEDLLLDGAHKEVRKRVEGIFDFISKPYNYQHGIFDRMLFLPLLKKFGVKHPETPFERVTEFFR